MEKMNGDMLEMILNSQDSRLSERLTKYMIYQVNLQTQCGGVVLVSEIRVNHYQVLMMKDQKYIVCKTALSLR